MKVMLIIFLSIFVKTACATSPRLFCHGDGIRSTLFYWNGKVSFEFVDIEFQTPKYLDSYLACTNFIFKLKGKDRHRKIRYAPLLNSLRKNFVRFADEEKAVFYDYCQRDPSCRVKFPYSLLDLGIFWNQLVHKPETSTCDDKRPAIVPTIIKLPEVLTNFKLWQLPEQDLIKEFWRVANERPHDKILISAMTYSLDFLEALKIKYQGSSTKIFILTSFNMMSLDERMTKTLTDLPPNLIFIPIFQSTQEPFSHHQKGAIFFNKDQSTVVWNSSNFRKYETFKLVDLGMTAISSELGNQLANRWLKSALTSCQDIEAMNCNLFTRFSNSPRELDLWKSITLQSCAQIPSLPQEPTSEQTVQDLLIGLIFSAKKSIHIHTHVFGNSMILKKLQEAQTRGIDVKIMGGKPSRFNPKLDWVKFNLNTKEHHAKFMIVDDSSFVWGTGNFTTTSLSNQREDFFYGSNPEILAALKRYFEMSWN
jgi:HKD family nuclease